MLSSFVFVRICYDIDYKINLEAVSQLDWHPEKLIVKLVVENLLIKFSLKYFYFSDVKINLPLRKS